MKKIFVSMLMACALLINCGGGDDGALPPPDKKDPPRSTDNVLWKLVFEDNFEGSSVNLGQWSMYNGSGHSGNGYRRPEAFSVENGSLVVTAQMKGSSLISGGMAHRRNFTYGKFEFRVRTEPDPSGAVSAVVLTWPQGNNWPVDGEMDIFETGTTSLDRSYFATFIHYDADNKKKKFIHEASGTEWRVMAMEWYEDAILIYRDGELVWTMNDPAAIVHVPHHLCIQLDAFKATMGDPVKMYVDWVKIYQPE